MSEFWYYAEGDDTRGPITFDQLIKNLSLLPSPRGILVWRDGFSEWKTAENVREIVEQLFRPPPLRPTPSETARREGPGTVPIGRENIDAVARYQQQFGKDEPEAPPDRSANTRGRVAFLIVLIIVFLAGTYFTNKIYANSANGIANLIGQLATPWIVLTAITWKIRHSTYTAATVLAVAALVTGSANISKLQLSESVQESRAALQGITDPSKIDEVVKQHPSNVFLQVMAVASKAATETNSAVEKLSDEIEPLALSKDVELVTASRKEIEALRRDLKTAEVNTTTFMPRYIALLKVERDKIENFAISLRFDKNTLSGFLKGVDERHAKITAFNSKMMLTRFEFYRAYQNYVAILLDEYGAYNVVNGKFSFPLQRTADRFNVAATAMDAAAKRVNELDVERKQIAQSQQDKWEQFVKGK